MENVSIEFGDPATAEDFAAWLRDGVANDVDFTKVEGFDPSQALVIVSATRRQSEASPACGVGSGARPHVCY